MSQHSTTDHRTRRHLRCVSVGYQGRSIDAFCDALQENGVEVLIDVRERAWSHRPEYRKNALASALSGRGVAYLHLREAGNPHRPRKGQRLSRDECIELYGDYLDENFAIVEDVVDALAQARSALFCYEAKHEECHRSVLLNRINEIASVHVIEV